jgi:hypothetical protein
MSCKEKKKDLWVEFARWSVLVTSSFCWADTIISIIFLLLVNIKVISIASIRLKVSVFG